MLSIWQNQITLQSFADHEDVSGYPEIKHGTLAEYERWAKSRNRAGFGIYATVNGTDGKGRKIENISELRSWYTDIDGLPTDEQKHAKVYDLLSAPLPPSAIVKTKHGLHCYWYAEAGQSFLNDRFRRTVKGIARFFGGDEGVCDNSRVLRLPGYLHQKDPSDPYLVETIWLDEGLINLEDELHAAYPPPEDKPVNPAARVVIQDAGDDWSKVLEALAAWPAPDQEKHRVLMVALGVAVKFSVPEARAVADLIPIVSTWPTREDAEGAVRKRAHWAYHSGMPATVAGLRSLGVNVPKLSKPKDSR